MSSTSNESKRLPRQPAKRRSIRTSLLVGLLLVAPATRAQTPPLPSSEDARRVDAMLHKLTLSQKIAILGGEDDFFLGAVPAIGLPRLRMSDGPVGVRTWGPSVAFPAGIALAATWDPDLAARVGTQLGQDARARGVHFLLGPGVNMYRASVGGRNFEYFGEDPFLAAHLAVPLIEGIQGQGVIATVKHFAANNQEWDRLNVSSDVDPRTLREIYLPAFEAAVKTAHVGAIMDGYNLVNGAHDTQNCPLNQDILKKEWGFDGIVMSDWGSTDDGIAAANCGLDLEMPSAQAMSARNLLPAIANGKVSEATIDDKVRRILSTSVRFGFFDRDQADLRIPLDNPASRQVALDEARESLTLLKNDRALLPLSIDRVKTIAVIGPDAWPAVPGGGGSSRVEPFTAQSLLTGLSQFVGPRVRVLYARGLPHLDELLENTTFSPTGNRSSPTSAGPVVVETFPSANFSGTAEISNLDHISGSFNQPFKPGQTARSQRYRTTFVPRETGKYLLVVTAAGGDAYHLLVDGRQLVEQLNHEVQAPHTITLSLTAGKPISLELNYQPDGPYLRAGLAISPVASLVSPEAGRVAAMADVALVAVGFDSTTEKEGMDRTFSLPWGQDELIAAVASANPNTIVDITAGGGVDMRPWIGQVPVFLHNWYPGQEGGVALPEILFGVRSPEGHLPASFERSWEDNPVHDSYYAAPAPNGGVAHVAYKEGVFLGYRYYTSTGKHPLFPFGFGLSYTTFAFSNLSIAPTRAAGGQTITVSFDIRNTGSREAADVAQLYLGDPSAKVRRPSEELKGFQKVRLAPGESRRIHLALDRRALAYWDVNRGDWRVDPGTFKVYVGDSSDNTPLVGDFTVTP